MIVCWISGVTSQDQEQSSVVMNHLNHQRIDLIPGTFPLAHHNITCYHGRKNRDKPLLRSRSQAGADKSNVSENVNRRETGAGPMRWEMPGYLWYDEDDGNFPGLFSREFVDIGRGAAQYAAANSAVKAQERRKRRKEENRFHLIWTLWLCLKTTAFGLLSVIFGLLLCVVHLFWWKQPAFPSWRRNCAVCAKLGRLQLPESARWQLSSEILIIQPQQLSVHIITRC